MPFPGYYDPTATRVAAGNKGHEGLSSALWRDVNESAVANNPGNGYAKLFSGADLGIFTTLSSTTTNEWVNNTEVNNGTVTVINGVTGATGPVLELDTASVTDLDGVNVQFLRMGVTPEDGYDIYFEARVAQTDIGGSTVSSSAEMFAGLASSSTTVMTGTIPQAADWMGFYTPLADGTLIFGVDEGTAPSITASSVHTLVDLDQANATVASRNPEAWVKLGCVLRGTANGGEYYVNGVAGTQSVTWTSGPDAVVYPTFVSQSNATTDPIVYLHWFKVAKIPTGRP